MCKTSWELILAEYVDMICTYIKIVIFAKNQLSLLAPSATSTQTRKFILIAWLKICSSRCSRVFDYLTTDGESKYKLSKLQRVKIYNRRGDWRDHMFQMRMCVFRKFRRQGKGTQKSFRHRWQYADWTGHIAKKTWQGTFYGYRGSKQGFSGQVAFRNVCPNICPIAKMGQQVTEEKFGRCKPDICTSGTG
jgi:hypothetical protein